MRAATYEYDRGLAGDFSFIAHESLHAFGLVHAHDDRGADYGDAWDVMGYYYTYQIHRPNGWMVGPESNAAHRSMLGVMPAGPLMVKVPVDSGYYTVEFRQRSGYDINLPEDAVQVHWVTGRDTYLQTSPADRLIEGDVFSDARLSVRVDAVDPGAGTATVTIAY